MVYYLPTDKAQQYGCLIEQVLCPQKEYPFNFNSPEQCRCKEFDRSIKEDERYRESLNRYLRRAIATAIKRFIMSSQERFRAAVRDLLEEEAEYSAQPSTRPPAPRYNSTPSRPAPTHHEPSRARAATTFDDMLEQAQIGKLSPPKRSRSLQRVSTVVRKFLGQSAESKAAKRERAAAAAEERKQMYRQLREEAVRTRSIPSSAPWSHKLPFWAIF
ncbi:hypothetical protein F5Y12DRAFT_576939 [Xylaria sp. FL1777]|nr:hypothetical protein F5Y12DRAFT_576939 [Xylaria sp. FL1777]